jgi:thiosulfate/3-mercaptopyruvate sulfurtransferase
MPSLSRRAILGLVAGLIASLALVRLAVAQAPALPPIRVVTSAWLSQHVNDPDVVVVQVGMSGMAGMMGGGHIPGARTLKFEDFVVEQGGLRTELPAPDKLRALFESIGISDSTLVVVTTDHEAPMASRLLMTLDYVGLTKLAWLDGGLAQWKAEGRALLNDKSRVTPGRITAKPRTDLVVDADWITAHQGKPGLALIDTRTDGEYVGGGDRHGMPSAGHLAGAHQLQWEQLFANPEKMQLKSASDLAKLYADRMQPGDTAVTYCWIGYRASMTYVAARILGLNARFYDGSYQDWLARKLPVTAGGKP